MSIIKEDIVNQGHGLLRAKYFAVHSTANPGATAQNHRDLWSRGYDSAVHLVSDWNQAIHCVPYDRLCWQVGNGNYTCEGLEICEATNITDFHKGIKIAATVIRERLTAHGWDTTAVKTHKWFSQTYGGSDHTDPIPYFTRFNYTWEEFIQEITNSTTPTITQGDDDMPSINDIKSALHDEFNTNWTRDRAQEGAMKALIQQKGNDGRNVLDGVIQTRWDVNALTAQVAALSEAVKTLATANGINPDDLTTTIKSAIENKLSTLEITLKAENND